ncbi:hypothetical protein HanXRQr2_Chr03g0136991 [Helianthus annuus]|uniref:Uncharacterized protein n=1 Tax=Helianthus annuus TaxID=4232 RepID=A0A9K3JLM9_HELAN|nr:hypothetical protein HanXRQr2_Chr03g0136991 [Helianthus annuus]KAJ0945930.1 hypothetical protein HanPSC8_Chr03g0133571 [Helianthus annuus]
MEERAFLSSSSSVSPLQLLSIISVADDRLLRRRCTAAIEGLLCSFRFCSSRRFSMCLLTDFSESHSRKGSNSVNSNRFC